MGGNPDPGKASISAGDIARIAQLYPSGTEAGEAAKKGDIWGAKQVVRVRVRDGPEITVFVAPMPTEVLWRY